MSDIQKKITTLKTLSGGLETELMPKTIGDQVYLNDETKLSPKISEMISAINLRAKKTEVEEMIKNAPKGDTGVCLSQEEYDALTDEEKDSDITYYIYDAENGGGSGGGDTGVWISQEEYDALSDEEKASDTTYYIYDADANPNAAAIPFTSENYTATNVGAALEEVKSKVTTATSNLKLDYSSARADVQDLNTFLQKALLLLFPKALCKYVVTSTGITNTDYGCKIVTYDYSTNTTTEVIVAGPYGTVDSGWHDDNITVTYVSGNFTIKAYRNVVINDVSYDIGTTIKTWHYTTAIDEEYTVNE